MPGTKHENQLHLDISEHDRRIALPEETLPGKQSIEEALLDSEKRYRRLFESAKDGILILEADTGKVVDVNPFLMKLLSYSYDELCGQHIWELGVFKDIAASKEAFKVLQENEYIRYDDLPLEALDGQHISVEFISNVYLVDNVKVIQCNIRDITARKRTEKALEAARLAALQEKNRLEAVMEALPVGVAILDETGGNILTNRTFDEVWGGQRPSHCSSDGFVGYKACWIETGQPVQPDEWASVRAVREDESVVGQLFRIERFDGTHGYIHNSAAPIHDTNGRVTGCAVAVMDISEQVAIKETLRLAKEAAESANLAKSQFLANMSHELRTPMTGILGMLHLALAEDLAPEPRNYLETTLSAANSLLRILNDILDMAKIEAGKITLEINPFSLQRCVTEAVNILTPEALSKGLDFALSMPEELPDMVAGDQMRLRQVLLNFIGNAVKFTSKGKVEVRVAAGETTFAGKREFTFTVSDTGIGIPDGKKGLLFRAFNQVDTSHNRSFGGTGLGLAISREIVDLMGGTISFESEEGVGSTFSFTIPLGKAHEESTPLHEAESLSSAPGIPAPDREHIPRILLVDDDPNIRKLLGLVFKKARYNFDLAEDGLKAVEMWENGAYDLVLMDIQMPQFNGFEATRAIREKERKLGGHIPIVAVTAHARKEDEESCLAGGMDAYISKPINFKKCFQVIEEIISKNPVSYADRETRCA